MEKIKFTTYYNENGSIIMVQKDPLLDFKTIKDYNKSEDETYYLEINSKLIECDKDKNILTD